MLYLFYFAPHSCLLCVQVVILRVSVNQWMFSLNFCLLWIIISMKLSIKKVKISICNIVFGCYWVNLFSCCCCFSCCCFVYLFVLRYSQIRMKRFWRLLCSFTRTPVEGTIDAFNSIKWYWLTVANVLAISFYVCKTYSLVWFVLLWFYFTLMTDTLYLFITKVSLVHSLYLTSLPEGLSPTLLATMNLTH